MEFLLDGQASGRGREVLCSCRAAWCTASPIPGVRKARMLVIGSRPAQMMVEEVGRLAEAGRLSPDTIMEVYRRHDSTLA
jgi:hypothetical protein